MATVGQQLSVPEEGWRRYDDADSRIVYSNPAILNDSRVYNGSLHYLYPIGLSDVKVNFKFYGTKLRIISPVSPNYIDNIKIKIDSMDDEIFSEKYSLAYNVIVYEKLGLSNTAHTVSIVFPANSVLAYSLDAIDIDADGYLVLPISVNLTAVADNSRVILNWDTVSGATGYNVKRSTTAGGPYTTIASNVSGTSYVDNDVVNGTNYYYIVTAITAESESANSNEASATPTAPQVEEGEAVLRVTMIDSSEREYQLTTTEIDGFINWINNHTSGDPASYMLIKNIGLRSSKEYLLFDKIISFEVTELK